MRKLLLITLPLLLIVGCSKEPINYETTLIERDGVYYTKDTNKPYTGPIFSINDNGKKEEEGTLKDGKKDGLYIEWYDNGNKFVEKPYKNGKLNGLYTIWWKNGNKMGELIYKDGSIDGPTFRWYKTGNITSEGFRKYGKRNGLYTMWYENGQKSSEGIYIYGELSSEKCWDENGNECQCSFYKYMGCD